MAFDSKDDHRRRTQSAASRHSPSAPPIAGSGQASTWFVALGVGFAIGVPVGAFFFPQADEFVPASEVVQVPAAQSAEQLAAAEARARKADEVAAAVKLPLPGMRADAAPEQADPGQAAAAQDPAEPPAAAQDPAAAAPAPEPVAPPTAATQTAAAQTHAPHPAPPAAPARAAPAAALPRLGSAPGLPSTQNPAPAAEAAAPATPVPPSPAAVEPPPGTPAVPGAPQVAANGQDGPRSVDELLDQALANSGHLPQPATRTAPATPTNTIPLSPSREDVTRAMTVLLPAIRGCAAGKSGLANVGIVVKNDGHVQSVSVTGSPFEGDRSGSCMEGVVRRARFPRFQQSSFRIQFPFAIQ